jgi:hypothetical protein
LRVLGTAERPQIDQGVHQQFHAKMSLLDVFKTEQQPLEFVLPRKGPLNTGSQGMDRFIEEAFASALGRLAIARVFFHVWYQARIEDQLPIVLGIKAAIEVEIGSCERRVGREWASLQAFVPLCSSCKGLI